MHRKPIIAIDGPAGSGKSTAARNLARALRLDHLDTGSMYRAATWKAMQSGIDLADESALIELVANIKIKLHNENGSTRVFIDGAEVTGEIRSEAISRNAHYVATSAACRRHIVNMQQEMGKNGGVVAEGRDIGTVVFPGAEVKFFIVASPEERAKRRVEQLAEMGEHAEYESVLNDIRLRDRRDSEREASPLRQADDAVVIDTSNNSRDETLAQMVDIVKQRCPELAESIAEQ